MQLTRDLATALFLDLLGTLLLVLGILGYVGIIPPLSAPAAYLTLGAVGLAATGLAMPLLMRGLRSQRSGPR